MLTLGRYSSPRQPRGKYSWPVGEATRILMSDPTNKRIIQNLKSDDIKNMWVSGVIKDQIECLRTRPKRETEYWKGLWREANKGIYRLPPEPTWRAP